jgi:hypothetical protein
MADPIFLMLDLNPTALVGEMIPLALLMIPIVAILTRHQQKMAEILHGVSHSSELQELRREVTELRAIVQNQTYAIESVTKTSLYAEVPPPARIPTIS